LNTPTAILRAAGAIKLVQNNPLAAHYDSQRPSRNVILYGFSWGDENLPERTNDEGTHILVIHSMIIESEKLWPGQEDYSKGSLLLKRTGFDYIISGDNHKSFSNKFKDRMIINCGSLMRKNVDQKDHKPCLWIIDTETRKEKQIFIPVAPAKDVLSYEEHEEKKEENKNLLQLLERIKGKTKIEGLEFKKNINMSLQGIREGVKNATNEIMEEATNEN
jgi:DNA repair exonuclease SbcCD nuclease subunit